MGARYLLGRTDVEVAAVVVWGTLGVFIGIGFAAFDGIIQILREVRRAQPATKSLFPAAGRVALTNS